MRAAGQDSNKKRLRTMVNGERDKIVKLTIKLKVKKFKVIRRKCANLLQAYSPQNIAGEAIDRLNNQRAKKAANDKVWLEIELRRKSKNDDSIVFLSDELTLADWEKQRKIEKKLLPDPWWFEIANKIHQIRPTAPFRQLKHASQRIKRGWDDTSTYDLGSWTTKTLSEQLEHLAKTTHGWPDNLYETFDEWAEVLIHQSSQLRRFIGSDEQEKALEKWYLLASKEDADPAIVKEARNKLEEIEASDILAGKKAMSWVAEHLEYIWD